MPRTVRIRLEAVDSAGQVAQGEVTLTFQEPVNRPPIIARVTASPSTVGPGQRSTITVEATDPEGGPLTFRASVLEGGGTIAQGPQPNVFIYTAPAS